MSAPSSKKKSSFIQTYLNLMKAFVGSGLLGMPFAFKNSGIVMGALCMLVLSCVAMHCILVLVRCQKEIGMRKYEKHLEETQGKHQQFDDTQEDYSDEEEEQSEKQQGYDSSNYKKTATAPKQQTHLLKDDMRANYSDYESTTGNYSSDEDNKNDMTYQSSSYRRSGTSEPTKQNKDTDYEESEQPSATEFSFALDEDMEQVLEKFSPDTFGQVGQFTLSRVGRIMIELLLIFTQTGFCIAYLIFISHNLENILGSSLPLEQWAYILIAGFSLVPFVLLRNIKYLTPLSIVSEITLVVGLSMVVYFDIDSLNSDTIQEAVVSFPFSTFPVFLGLAIYSFEGIGLVLPIHNNMKNRNHFKFVVIAAFVSYLILMLLFGMLGFLAFGDDVSDNITDNLKSRKIPNMIIEVALIVALYFTYPMQLFPVPELADSYMSNIGILNNFMVKWLVRIFMVVLTMVIAIPGGKYFGIILSYVGAVGGSSLAFTLPGLISLVLFWKKNSWIWRIKDALLTLFGLTCLILTVSVNTYQIIFVGSPAGG